MEVSDITTPTTTSATDIPPVVDKNEYWRKRYREAKSRGVCVDCETRPPLGSRYVRCQECLDYYRNHYETKVKDQRDTDEYREYRNRNQRKTRDKLKLLCFEKYGGAKCVCCGEATLQFLEIDHINNDGANHRRQMREAGHSNNIYQWLRQYNFPDIAIQVLCANCNKAKWRYGICPHQQEICNG